MTLLLAAMEYLNNVMDSGGVDAMCAVLKLYQLRIKLCFHFYTFRNRYISYALSFSDSLLTHNNVAIRVEMLTRPHVLEILFSFLDGSGRGLALGLIEKISYCCTRGNIETL